jgi:cold shock CspA family protein
MASENTTQETTTQTTARQTPTYVGCVKWFNSDYGYGFITTISEGEYQGKDIFIHHSHITTSQPVYRRLNNGETVMYDIEAMEDEKHPYQAVNVCGYQDVPLQCESNSGRSGYRGRPGRGRGGGRRPYNSGRGRGSQGQGQGRRN